MSEPAIVLSELLRENNMKMQSSTIYRALRGEGMRVVPLVGNKTSSETQKVVVPSHMVVTGVKQASKRPGTASTGGSAPKTAYVGKIFDLRQSATKEGGQKVPAIDQHPRTTTKVVMEFKKRDISTPVSTTSTQRVPFTSTKLEKHVSRESLKEDGSDKKAKIQKKLVGTRMTGRKTSKDQLKSRLITPRASRVPSTVPTSLTLYKHRKIKAGDKNKTTTNVAEGSQNSGEKVGPNQSKVVRKPLPRSAPRDGLNSAQKTVPGSAQRLPPGGTQKLHSSSRQKLGKPPGIARNVPLGSKHKLQPGSSRKPTAKTDNILRTGSRRSVGIVNSAAGSKPLKFCCANNKKLWIPTSEAYDSWNQYCPITKVKAQRKKKAVKRKPIEFEASSSGRSDFFEGSDDESTEMDDEERKRLRELEIRRKMEQKSVEFFNQFKYGEMLKKIIPKIRYKSEIRPAQQSDVRLSDVEIKMRLSRLDESASRINELIPKWSSMLMTTRETNREERISKTLTNARHILDCKVDRAKEMLARYSDVTGLANPTEEMEDIKRHSELVQLDMNSLERMFAAHEKQLADELDEPTSISP
ncbi:hypothetical protein GE061_010683 [Apolygus lucorum]|uniref:Uncharacterized protein n=1 Tax=Apolygus lucorum TaxID=248454 RepID=A0A6A4IS38_APOLU|nr:hypothetical protein GE061_010683 [Apolygus lucorum]